MERVKINEIKKVEKGIYLFFLDYKGREKVTLVTWKGLNFLNKKDFFVGEIINVEKRIKNDKVFYMVKKKNEVR